MIAHQNTTKPSRINRKLKRRWKRPVKIADLVKAGLTDCYRVVNLCPLSQKTKVGIETPRIGHNRPLSTVVFYIYQKAMRR